MKAAGRIILLIIVTCGCYYDLDMPHVVSVEPGKNRISVDLDSSVTVLFSEKMDTMKTSKEFTLSSSAGYVEGYFSWADGDSILIFRPSEPFKRAEKYTVRITEEAEDSNGNDLRDEFVSSFYTAGDNVRPVVESFEPEDNSTGNGEDAVVAVFFSEEMDPDTLYEGMAISPATEGYYEWNSDRTAAMFRPLKGFCYGVTYTVTVNTNMRDAAGNSLVEENIFRFTVGDDFAPPELSVFQNNIEPLYFDENIQVEGAEKNGSIVMDFNEVVAADMIAGAVSIVPEAGFYISTSVVDSGNVSITRAVINFTEDLAGEEVYTLKISSSIKDLQDNSLAGDYRYVFVTNGTFSLRPYVSRIGDLASIDTVPWNINDIVMSGLYETDNLYEDIAIDFSSVIDPLSLEITVDMVAGNSGTIPVVVNTDWPVNPPDAKFTRLSFGLYGVSIGKTYRIRVKGGTGGLKDQYGNFMKEDFEQIIKFNPL